VIDAHAAGYNITGDPRPAVTAYVAQHQINEGTYPSLAALVHSIAQQVTQYGSISKMPVDQVGNTRNDMYLASEAARFPATHALVSTSGLDVDAWHTAWHDASESRETLVYSWPYFLRTARQLLPTRQL
jgi:PiT family inorganic phosphate transporter